LTLFLKTLNAKVPEWSKKHVQKLSAVTVI
jgi:hypothetical protein